MRLVLLLAACLTSCPAHAHRAATGWLYDPSCCGDKDCYEIEDSEVQAVPGGWQINATGEVFRSTQVKHSPDGRFHRCSGYGQREKPTMCLYVPHMGT
jgi:hypothetical protein